MEQYHERGGDWRLRWKRTGPERYEFSSLGKFGFLMPALLLIVPFMLKYSAQDKAMPIVLSFAIMALMPLAIFSFMRSLGGWLAIDSSGLEIRPTLLGRKTTIPWGRLLSVLDASAPNGIRALRITFSVANSSDSVRTITVIFPPYGATAEQLLGLLRKRARKPSDVRKHLLKRLQSTYETGNIPVYRGWKVSAEGINKGSTSIAWGSILRAHPAPHGWGIVLYYIDGANRGKPKRLAIPCNEQLKFKRFLKHLLMHTEHIESDAAFINQLAADEESPSHLSIGTTLAVGSSAIGMISITTALGYYTSGADDPMLYWLAIPFALWISAIILGSQKHVRANSGKHNSIVGYYSLASLPLGIILFFSLHTGAMAWLKADMYQAQGEYDLAEAQYAKCLSKAPASIYITLDIAINCHMKGDWEGAVRFFDQAYRLDPEYWHHAFIMRKTDALMKLGRDEEAQKWCQKIHKDYPRVMPSCDGLEKRLEGFRERNFGYRPPLWKQIIKDISTIMKNTSGFPG